MKLQMDFPAELVDAIADRVVEKLLPRLQTDQDSILTVDEVSMLLKKRKEQVYQWTSDAEHGLNDFPFGRAGKSLRFSRIRIIEWMWKNGKNS